MKDNIGGNYFEKITVYALLFVVAIIAAGCGSNAASDATSDESAQVKKITVGTANDFEQVAFLDENGKLTGYDVEVIKEIDKRLTEYEFEFQTMDFSNILLSLETKKVDIAAHLFEKTRNGSRNFRLTRSLTRTGGTKSL